MTTEVVKRKLTNYFDHADRLIILQAVDDVHNILVNASMLLRAYYLKNFENVLEMTKKTKKSEILDDKDSLIITKDIIKICCDIVQDDKIKKHSKTALKDDTKEENKRLINEYNDRVFADVLNVANDIPNLISISKLSISHILAYSVETLLTAYENNIVAHFPKYLKKYIRCDLITKYPEDFVLEKTQRYISSYVSRKILYNIDLPTDFPRKYDDDIIRYTRLLMPHSNVVHHNRDYDIKKYKWEYLHRMVYINRCLETDFNDVPSKLRKLYNPLPFHSSNIPNHIRLDTSGITQLLMNKQRISDFILNYKGKFNIELKMKNKGDMLSSFLKLTGKVGTLKEQAEFSSEFWYFFSPKARPKIDNVNRIQREKNKSKNFQDFVQKRKNGDWRFDNAIVTDGYSASFQITKEELFGKKLKFVKQDEAKIKKQDERDAKEKGNKESIIKLSEFPDTESWTGWGNSFKTLSLDPGKNDILCLTDGRKVLRYTRAKRQKDTHFHTKTRLFLKFRKKCQISCNTNIHDFESEILSLTISKSCVYKSFIDYINLKLSIATSSRQLYRKPIFRQWRFLTYVKTKSSEAKFIKKINNSFTPKKCSSEIEKDKKILDARINRWQNGSFHDKIVRNYNSKSNKIVIAWGNWGKNPNIKGCAPTPGIGIRRRFAKVFETVTTCERMTSQECCCCREKVTNPQVGKWNKSKHHLLHCTNANCCCRWWNRNVLGSYNILVKFISNENYIGDQSNNGEIKSSPIRDDPLY